MARPAHLPDFDEPPLTEVALSLQFQDIPAFGFADIGLLWERFRERFPKTAYQPPLAPTFETFGLRQGLTAQLQINFAQTPTIPRTWFLDEAGNEIVQFQANRFVRNWRKIGGADGYPRYEQIRERFKADLAEFNTYLAERKLGPLVPNQCEITYVNEIVVPKGTADPTSAVFKGMKFSAGAELGKPEDVTFTARYVISNSDGEPIGRMIAQSSPGLDQAGKPSVQFMLIARGPPNEPTTDAALDFMDIARDRIVRGFAEMTTSRMHKIWQRRN